MSEDLVKKARETAYSLGIPVWIAPDGSIKPHGPGTEIRPGKGAKPIPHGSDVPVGKSD